MRTLNKKQIALLDKACQEYHQKTGGYLDMDSLPVEIWEQLERMNDHETIYQNIQRYIWDWRFESQYA